VTYRAVAVRAPAPETVNILERIQRPVGILSSFTEPRPRYARYRTAPPLPNRDP
jgi:hypothetical protein